MCGIVGYTGKRNAIDLLLRGLRRLEYRGYDSAGLALFQGSRLEVRKSQGRLANVEETLKHEGSSWNQVTCGIGHTRWATHGKPTTQNAHPHRCGHVVIVHNGIIENYLELRKELISRGHQPQSETDSELYGFLVLEEMNAGKPLAQAAMTAFRKLEGQCSVVVLSEKEPGRVVGIRQGSPLVVAQDPEGGVIFASDAQPIVEYTRDVVFLENGDAAVGDPEKGLQIFDFETGKPVTRAVSQVDWSPEQLDRGGFAHYMLKEIHEQPNTFVDTLNGLLDREHTDPFPLAKQQAAEAILRDARALTLVACGTSWHAALLGKYWLEKWGQIPVSVELASEYRYRKSVQLPGEVIVGITQSGETADTLAVLRDARSRGIPTLGITNVRGSTIAREAQATLFTSAGPEVGVAATKTFTAQMLTLLLMAGYLARSRRSPEVEELFQSVLRLPHAMEALLDRDGDLVKQAKAVARSLQTIKGFFFIGRGTSFPIALEGALKLKEIAYVHAEGYAAGELKHGPIAMIDQSMAVVVLAPRDGWRDKTVSNLEEVKARGATIIGVGSKQDESLRGLCDFWIPVPDAGSEELTPFMLAPVLQLLSYEIATLKGTDIDKPRNLAKSVTVE